MIHHSGWEGHEEQTWAGPEVSAEQGLDSISISMCDLGDVTSSVDHSLSYFIV